MKIELPRTTDHPDRKLREFFDDTARGLEDAQRAVTSAEGRLTELEARNALDYLHVWRWDGKDTAPLSGVVEIKKHSDDSSSYSAMTVAHVNTYAGPAWHFDADTVVAQGSASPDERIAFVRRVEPVTLPASFSLFYEAFMASDDTADNAGFGFAVLFLTEDLQYGYGFRHGVSTETELLKVQAGLLVEDTGTVTIPPSDGTVTTPGWSMQVDVWRPSSIVDTSPEFRIRARGQRTTTDYRDAWGNGDHVASWSGFAQKNINTLWIGPMAGDDAAATLEYHIGAFRVMRSPMEWAR